MVRNRQKPKRMNGARGGPTMSKSYQGNARFVEIGSPGVLFRLCVNLDKVDNVRFEENFEDMTPAEGAPPIKKALGWAVIVTQTGQQNGITFPQLEQAMGCYNSIMKMISGVGCPIANMGPLAPPPPPLEEAVHAGDLHPDLLKDNEGDGMAENDDVSCDCGEPSGWAEHNPDKPWLHAPDCPLSVENGAFLEDENFEISEDDEALLAELDAEDLPGATPPDEDDAGTEPVS